MTTFLLVRHGANDFIGNTLVGRRPGVSLNDLGRRQADALAVRLGDVPIAAVYSSPLERTRETAAPLAARLGLDIRPLEGIHEIDPGDWAGRALDELRALPEWNAYCAYRSGTPCPNGETMLQVQARFVAALERLRVEHPGQTLALFSHADPIRIALAHYIGIPLDHVSRLDIAPASVSILALADWGPRVLRVNDTGAITLT